MHVWTLLQHTMIVFYVLSTVHKVLTLFTCDNGSEKGTGVNERNTHVTPFGKYGLK